MPSNIALGISLALFLPVFALVGLGLSLIPLYAFGAWLAWREHRRRHLHHLHLPHLPVPSTELEAELWDLSYRDFGPPCEPLPPSEEQKREAG